MGPGPQPQIAHFTHVTPLRYIGNFQPQKLGPSLDKILDLHLYIVTIKICFPKNFIVLVRDSCGILSGSSPLTLDHTWVTGTSQLIILLVCNVLTLDIHNKLGWLLIVYFLDRFFKHGMMC